MTKHHLDRRVAAILTLRQNEPDDLLLSTREVADWLGVSLQWLEIGRVKGWGPVFLKLGPKRIRYRRGDVIAWLASRRHASTAEYEQGAA